MNPSPAASDVVELLQALVRIPSVNPTGDPGVPASDTGEARCAAFVADRLETLGARVELKEILPRPPERPRPLPPPTGPASRSSSFARTSTPSACAA